MNIHRFTVAVDCGLPNDCALVDRPQDERTIYHDRGMLILPEGYTAHGEPTRLVINCHGAGGTVTTDDSQTEHQVLTQYLVANGYAVMDVNGLPEAYAQEHGIDIRNNVGAPIALRCYLAAYAYCTQHFHLKPEVLVHGASMGGISSANLVLSGRIPVLAHSAFCPVLDTYHQIFLHPWSGGLPRVAMAKMYGFDTDGQGDYIYDESRLAGYNPVRNPRAVRYPVPVKFWHCMDDDVVSWEVTRDFVDRICQNGGEAHLCALPCGGHEPQLVGEAIANPCGNTYVDGMQLAITPAVEEAFVWLRNFG